MDSLELAVQADTAKPSLKSGRWWVLTIGTLGLIALIAVFGRQKILNNLGPIEQGLAPDFEMQTFNGETLRLSDYQGQVVVLNFWASWCIPCRDEAPFLEQVWQHNIKTAALSSLVSLILTQIKNPWPS